MSSGPVGPHAGPTGRGLLALVDGRVSDLRDAPASHREVVRLLVDRRVGRASQTWALPPLPPVVALEKRGRPWMVGPLGALAQVQPEQGLLSVGRRLAQDSPWALAPGFLPKGAESVSKERDSGLRPPEVASCCWGSAQQSGPAVRWELAPGRVLQPWGSPRVPVFYWTELPLASRLPLASESLVPGRLRLGRWAPKPGGPPLPCGQYPQHEFDVDPWPLAWPRWGLARCSGPVVLLRAQRQP
jgi:hypothetical protein